MRPAGWGILGAAIFFVLFLLSAIPAALESAGGGPGFFTGVSAFFLILAVLSFPVGLIFELFGWLHNKYFGKQEKRKEEKHKLKEEESSLKRIDQLHELKEKVAISQEKIETKKQELLDKT